MFIQLKYCTALIIIVTQACTSLPSTNYNKMASLKNSSAIQLPVEGELPTFDNATAWLNTQPLKVADLRGKVALINFCTYSCINWLRTLPYVRAWAAKYKDKGLVVVGVHTPEFAFEHDIDKVRGAITEMKIVYPVAMDNGYSIWRAFDNQYWPALYFIDAKGKIRHHQFGEGAYEESEKIIQQLLAEAGAANVDKELVAVNAAGIEAAADWNSLQSNENYLGYDRTENFASPGHIKFDRNYSFTAPAEPALNSWGLSGDWTIKKQSILLNKANGKIIYRFHARDLHLVMGPGIGGAPVNFRVLVDGKPPAGDHGKDIDAAGYGTVKEYRLYQLIRQSGDISDKLFEIEFMGTGVEAFSFTFG